jgi:hypothetical protein
VNLIERTTGSGIFDKSIISKLRKIEDPDPYFRGIISEIDSSIDINNSLIPLIPQTTDETKPKETKPNPLLNDLEFLSN